MRAEDDGWPRKTYPSNLDANIPNGLSMDDADILVNDAILV